MAERSPIPFYHLFEGRHGRLREMRFWSKVDMRTPDECWDWQASRTTSGYGRFKVASNILVHSNRVAWALANKADPGEMWVLHSCDRPRCCNPNHLRLGTVSDNVADMDARGRRVVVDQSGESNGGAKIDEALLALIVARLNSGWNNTDIADDLPISHSMVSRIRLGLAWREQAARLGWRPSAQFRRPPTKDAA